LPLSYTTPTDRPAARQEILDAAAHLGLNVSD
jgi:hypothetical protein